MAGKRTAEGDIADGYGNSGVSAVKDAEVERAGGRDCARDESVFELRRRHAATRCVRFGAVHERSAETPPKPDYRTGRRTEKSGRRLGRFT